MDYGDFKEMLRKFSPDNQMQVLKIDLSDLDIVKDLLHIYQRLYQHELMPEPLKNFIYMEVRRALRKDYNIKAFLEGKEDIIL